MTKYEPNIWHGWNGGECPVHPETVVEVQLQAGRYVEKAKCYRWSHINDGSVSDIIAFRIIKEHKEPRVVWMRWNAAIGAWQPCEQNHVRGVMFREVVE